MRPGARMTRKGLKVTYSKPSVGYVDGTLKLASTKI